MLDINTLLITLCASFLPFLTRAVSELCSTIIKLQILTLTMYLLLAVSCRLSFYVFMTLISIHLLPFK